MLRPLVLLAITAAAVGCDSSVGDSQRLFEDRALSAPVEGITAIDADGTVRETDPDDWRIAPAFDSDVRFAFLPTPNPASSAETVSLQLVGAFSATLPGLQARVLRVDGRTGVAELLPLFGGTCRAGSVSCTFSLRASQIDIDNTGGIYRVVVDDGRAIVTYGDIEVRR